MICIKFKHLQLIAIFICTLILSMPFYGASVYASVTGRVRNVVVAGETFPDIEGYTLEDDDLLIQAEVKIDDDGDVLPVNPNQVRLPDEAMQFDYCDPMSGGFHLCGLSYPAPTRGFSKTKRFTVAVYDEFDKFLTSSSGTVTVDEKDPTIESLSVLVDNTQLGISTTGEVTVDWEVKDSAYRGCSGISTVEFRTNSFSGPRIHEEDLDTDDCKVSDTFTYQTPVVVGQVKICAIAYDLFGHSSDEDEDEACVTFGVDREGPGIVGGSLKVSDETGRELSFYGKNEVPAKVNMLIYGSDLGDNNVERRTNVKADLSELNPNQNYNNMNPTLVLFNPNTNVTNCTWDIELKPASAGSKIITITATDRYGNLDTEQVPKSFTYDETGPNVAAFGTDMMDADGNTYARKNGNNLTVLFNDGNGVGVGSSNVELVIDDNIVPNDADCRGAPGSTICFWEDVNLNINEDTKVRVKVQGTDRLGNGIQANEFNLSVDVTPPVIPAAELDTRLIVTSDNRLGKITTGDTLYVIANITDFTPVSAKTDLSRLREFQDDVGGTCFNIGKREWACTWTGPIDMEGPDFGDDGNGFDIPFTFTDLVGNKVTVTKQDVKLHERVEAEAPEFYNISLDISMAQPIERNVITYFGGNHYFQIMPFNLEYNGGCTGGNAFSELDDDIEVLNMRLYPPDQGYAYFARKPNTQDYVGFFQFAIDYATLQTYAEEESMTIGVDSPIQVEFDVVCNRKSYIQPEIEPVMFTIPIIDEDPDAAEDLEDDIEEIREDVEVA
ncbi:hypothetical protein ACFLZ6_00910 [Nanoarchaeota archaeon]